MERPRVLARLRDLYRSHPVVTLVGPRQCGKTTLALEFARTTARRWGPVTHFDLEDSRDLARLDNPRLAFEDLTGLVIIDEIQRRPELFPTLRVLVDRAPKHRRFLVLGSASGELLQQSSESLAGRTAFLELTPFARHEVPSVSRLWLRGGFPRAYLARSDRLAFSWLDEYISTFLERDIPSFGIRVPAEALRRFWMMLAHVHGGVLNHAELGRAFGATNKTIAHYLDILASTFMVRLLPPWFENISKRQVKAPKVFFRDTGLFHALLGVRAMRELVAHPRVGASWEGFALECVIRELELKRGEVYFWATHAHAELDLLAIVKGQRFGFEFKRADAPKLTPSMAIAVADLKLRHLFVINPGDATFPLTEQITALGLDALGSLRQLTS
jgi:predicted AAA+ superfamily ATPase